ncbi:ABC transporter ATP-binding protein [Microbulbifer halophilus]|uniref:ABC transporter ATP-binding protein n=1 Tax=Microbulbifer halophilus TaxID=453963 RepID=A0ABW5EDD4_9GAMM|nr:ATP-binding cassette domain-containing protein [Microbulbifer halophilus]MCW8126203.1 ATP-binding cassette domain-containing protein [Microbulbifer halophilus]
MSLVTMPKAGAGEVVLRAENLTKTFRLPGGDNRHFAALDQLNFSLGRGRTLAVVGESGSGKSTMAKLVMKLQRPTAGRVSLRLDTAVRNIHGLPARDLYRKIQMVFQDPYASLNPRKRIWRILSAPLCNYGRLDRGERQARALRHLRKVGLGEAQLYAFPHMLSGGQRQRVNIARALVTEPEILILDEPLSALDVSVQAQIVNLLLDLQRDLGLTYLFISHDLAVVRHFADQVLVMKSGEMVEWGGVEQVLEYPAQEYTRQLLHSAPGRPASTTAGRALDIAVGDSGP